VAEPRELADELGEAQAALGRAIGRARSGEDTELAGQVRERGEQLSVLLAGLLKLTRVHAPDNHAFDTPVTELARALSALDELVGTVHLVTVEDQIYVNDVRIRTDGRSGARELGHELMRHNVGGLSFHRPLDDGQLRRLVAALAAAPNPTAPRRTLSDRLTRDGLSSLELQGIFRFQTSIDESTRDRAPELVAARLLALVADAFEAVGSGRALNPLPLRRAVLEAVEIGLAVPAFWAPFPDAPPHAAHAVEVAFVALLTGRAAGFSAAYLQDLGIAALVHDAGYLAPGLGDDPASLQRHGVEGARVLLRQKGFHEAKVRRLRAVLEHHRDFAGAAGRPSPGGALLRLAEDYVNAVRFYGARITRAAALAAVARAGGALYHPALAQVMVNALGAWPPGSLIALADGRVVRVAVPPASPDRFARPVVQHTDPTTRNAVGPTFDLGPGDAIAQALPG
jgi:hypothetical protein